METRRIRGILSPPKLLFHLNACFTIILTFTFLSVVLATTRYYGTYISYGTGDTFIDTQHGHGGPKTALRKWNIECLDGEAMIGVRDFVDDFQRLVAIWCKFMFPYKAPTSGLYPYYPNCHTRNLTTDFFCFNPSEVGLTINTFVTGFYDTDYQFRIDRVRDDHTNMYKCCRTPIGYYIDYVSCNYKPTRDQYWEYYDAGNFIVMCETGYVMTGMAKKINPWDSEYHLEWVQCCRVGFSPGMIARPLPTLVAPRSPSRIPFNRNADGFYG